MIHIIKVTSFHPKTFGRFIIKLILNTYCIRLRYTDFPITAEHSTAETDRQTPLCTAICQSWQRLSPPELYNNVIHFQLCFVRRINVRVLHSTLHLQDDVRVDTSPSLGGIRIVSWSQGSTKTVIQGGPKTLKTGIRTIMTMIIVTLTLIIIIIEASQRKIISIVILLILKCLVDNLYFLNLVQNLFKYFDHLSHYFFVKCHNTTRAE